MDLFFFKFAIPPFKSKYKKMNKNKWRNTYNILTLKQKKDRIPKSQPVYPVNSFMEGTNDKVIYETINC